MIDVLTKTMTNIDLDKYSIDVIVLKVKNLAFGSCPWEIKILGKPMIEWVRQAVGGYNICEAECDANSDILSIIKSNITDAEYTLVLFSDTPLITKKTIDEIVNYVAVKQPSVCKLTRGYVFKNDFLRTADKIYTVQPQYFDEEDFITAYNNHQLILIGDILKNRIISFHTKNGVRFVDSGSVYIESDVLVGSGTEVWPGNNLAGICKIGKNVKLLPNNFIENSIVEDNCEVINSVIRNSKISNNSQIGPFEKIIN